MTLVTGFNFFHTKSSNPDVTVLMLALLNFGTKKDVMQDHMKYVSEKVKWIFKYCAQMDNKGLTSLKLHCQTD